MSRSVIFVPASSAEVSPQGSHDFAQVNAPKEGLRAFTATPELLEVNELAPSDQEAADFLTLHLASIAELQVSGGRRVLVAEVDPAELSSGDDVSNGEVLVRSVSASDWTAFFQPDDNSINQELANRLRDMSLDQAWEDSEVQQLLAEQELLWHNIGELLTQ